MSRIKAAGSLQHAEQIGPFELTIEGGLGSFSIGTFAQLKDSDGVSLGATYSIPSWVWNGKETAIWGARRWALGIIEKRMPGEDYLALVTKLGTAEIPKNS